MVGCYFRLRKKRLVETKALNLALDVDALLVAEPHEGRQCDVESPSTGRLSADPGAPSDLAMEETPVVDSPTRFSSRKCLPQTSRHASCRFGNFKKNR